MSDTEVRDTAAGNDAVKKLSVMTLAAMVVGSMVGAGVFSLPSRFANETGVYGAVISWTIAGAGMLMLAFVFQTLAIRKPELDAGVYAYAKAGFGEYLGFFSAFGFWASSCVGNVTYWVLIMSTIGGIAPWLGHGDTLAAVLLSSVAIWVFAALIMRGVQGAATINRIVTIAKMIPIAVFILVSIFYFHPHVFVENFRGTGLGSLFSQVKGTMLATVFVFLGIEGASVYSRYAKKREDVGRATVLGFLSVLAIFATVTIVSYGILPRAAMANLRQPSMSGVFQASVGHWGGAFISIGLIISVLGAYLAWTLMSAEVLTVAARDKDMPKFLSTTNSAGSPVNALLMTTMLIQVMLFVTLFSDDAFNFMLNMTSALSLIPFLLAAGYAFKLVVTNDTYDVDPSGKTKDLVIGAVATFYTAFLLYAAGPKYMLVSFIIYAPGTVLFVMARREQGRILFSPRELVILVISIAGALLGLVALIAGWISI